MVELIVLIDVVVIGLAVMCFFGGLYVGKQLHKWDAEKLNKKDKLIKNEKNNQIKGEKE